MSLLKEAVKRKLVKEAKLNPLRWLKKAPGAAKKMAQKGYTNLQVGTGKLQQSNIGKQLLGDANFMGSSGLLHHGVGSNMLPLGTMAQQGKSLYSKVRNRFK